MSNHLMRYKGARGCEYRKALYKDECPKCKDIGYVQLWYTNLGSYVYSVQHRKKMHHKTRKHPTGYKTYKRCWF